MLILDLGLLIASVALIARNARGPQPGYRSVRSQRILALISLAVALLASLWLLIAPSYNTGQTLIQVNGPRALIGLVVPVIIATVPFISRRPRPRAVLLSIAAALAAAFTILSGFSIGTYYVPEAALLFAAAGLTGFGRPTTSGAA